MSLVRHALISWCTTALLLTSVATVFAASPCEQWLNYRDGELFREWDRQMGRYLLSQEALTAMQDLKANVQSETSWALSTTGVQVGQFASAVLTATHIIRDGIKILPVASGATALEEAGACLISADEEAILKGDRPSPTLVRAAGQKCLLKAAKRVAAKFGYGWVNQVYESLSAIEADIKDIQRIERMPREQDALRRTVVDQVERLDVLIARYQGEMRAAVDRADELNQFKERMDTICSGNDVDRLMIGIWTIRSNFDLECATRTVTGTMTLQDRVGPGKYSGRKEVSITTILKSNPGCVWDPHSLTLGARQGTNVYTITATQRVLVTVIGPRVVVAHLEKLPTETSAGTYEYALAGTTFSNEVTSYARQ